MVKCILYSLLIVLAKAWSRCTHLPDANTNLPPSWSPYQTVMPLPIYLSRQRSSHRALNITLAFSVLSSHSASRPLRNVSLTAHIREPAVYLLTSRRWGARMVVDSRIVDLTVVWRRRRRN